MDVVKVTATFLAAFDPVYSAHLAAIAREGSRVSRDCIEFSTLDLDMAEEMSLDHATKLLNVSCLLHLRVASKKLLLAMLEHREGNQPPSMTAITGIFTSSGYDNIPSTDLSSS